MKKSEMALAFLSGFLFVIVAMFVVIIAVLAHAFTTVFSLIALIIAIWLVLSFTKPFEKISRILNR